MRTNILLNSLKILTGLLILALPGSSSALVIDFSGVSAGIPTLSSYSESGFTFTSEHFHTFSSPALCLCADDGFGYIGEEDGGVGVDITMALTAGGPFSLISFAGAELWVPPAPPALPNATEILVTGSLFGGGSVFQSFSLDGVVDGFGGPADFQAFLLPGTFTNLVSVTFSGHRGESGGGAMAIANLNLNIHEPAAAGLLALGLVGLGLSDRLRKTTLG